MPEIVDCACGKDHEVMPVAEDGYGVYELVCRLHKRHLPCRRCRADLEGALVTWAKSEQARLEALYEGEDG
jgi:hypothetical protein